MRVKEIRVEGLFDTFDHVIPLNLDDHITIIHGGNGFGKTVLLQMVHGLLNNSLQPIASIPFRKFQICYEGNCRVEVRKRISQESHSQIHISYYESGSKQESSFCIQEYLNDLPHIIDLALPTLRKYNGLERWVDEETDQILDSQEIFQKFGDKLPLDREILPEWWLQTMKSIDNRLIETQRLLGFNQKIYKPRKRRADEFLIPIVQQYAQELATIIQKKFVDAGYISQELDRSYPTRLAKRLEQKEPTDRQLQQQLQELKHHWELFNEVGLLNDFEETTQLPDINDKTRNILAIYIEDANKKLNIFNDLAQKIKLFRELINQRFLYKKIEISRENGFSFITKNGDSLPITALSSGEQHELALFYQLIFKMSPNSLILIDEPELSLHVVWQQYFLKDLQRIIAQSPFDVIIATHSPQIIHDRWDLTVELKGMSQP